MTNNTKELSTPTPEPVDWAGWATSNPNRVARVRAKLWYDARDMVARELKAVDVFSIEVVRASGNDLL